ncbi:MAG: hypothetical protein VX768_16310 [Planctomycetota bacterium]|nr:hypothetical protein [Planctomycetota bacterium]
MSTIPGNQPASETSRSQREGGSERDANQTVPMAAMVGAIACGGIQALTLGGGDLFFLLAIASLLAWFLLTRQILPVYLLFVGGMIARIVILFGGRFFGFGAGDFLMQLLDSVTFVGLMACSFIFYELSPQRLEGGRSRGSVGKKSWHMFEPFSGLVVRLPIATAMAILVYFLAQQIPSPIDPVILQVKFAQAYLLCCILFLVYLLVRTGFDTWSWLRLSPRQARFFIRGQEAFEMREELDAVCKPGWSRVDHASAAGGMFLLQTLLALPFSASMFFLAWNTRGGFMWPVVAGMFVFLTSLYNTIKLSRGDVTGDKHLVSLVAFVVVSVVGMRSLGAADWSWKMIYCCWWALHAIIIIRLSYLWLMDESIARQRKWDSAKPFSLVRFLVILGEGLFGLFVLLLVLSELNYQFWYPGS